MKTPEEAALAYRKTVDRHHRPDKEASSGFRIAFDRCDSPIEQAFCLELFQLPGVRAVEGNFGPQHLVAATSATILVFAQEPILHYWADFLLVGVSPILAEPRFVIVECDGLDYHSTREQVRRDAARQESLIGTGFHVIRHTGSEIFRDPHRVASRTLEGFADHGWKPPTAARWVNNGVLLQALAELRAQAESIE